MLLLDGDWKGWIWTLLLDGNDPDVVEGWIRTWLLDGDWKWKEIWTLLEDDFDAVAGSGRRSGRCWKWKKIQTLLEVKEDLDVTGR